MTATGFTVESCLNLDKTVTDMVDRCTTHYEFTPNYLHYPANLAKEIKVVKGIRLKLDTDLADYMIVLSDTKSF